MNPYFSNNGGSQARNPYGTRGARSQASNYAADHSMIGDAMVVAGLNANSLPITAVPPALEAPELHHVQTTRATEATSSSDSQHAALIASLQAKLEDLQETNFDLQATMATMQAEQRFSIQRLEAQTKKEISNLQNKLRLEQQTTQRLLQQKQNQPKRTRVDPDDDVFRKRLPAQSTTPVDMMVAPKVSPAVDLFASSPGPPPEITMRRTGRPSTGTATTAGSTPLHQSPEATEIDPTVKTIDITSKPNGGAIWLSRKLLYHVSAEIAPKVHRILVQIATNEQSVWSECQLVEYLLQQPPEALTYWEQALLWSLPGRQGIISAMEAIERTEEEADSVPTLRRRRVPRIHRLNPDGSVGPALIKRESTYIMSSDTVHNWVGNRLDINNSRHLQLLALLLEDCPPHSTSLWWNVLLSGVTKQIVNLHAQFTQKEQDSMGLSKTSTTPSSSSLATAKTSMATTPSTRNRNRVSIITRRRDYSWIDRVDIRRFRFQSPAIRETMDPEARDVLLLASMALMERLVMCTRLDILGTWYGAEQNVPKQPYLMEDPGDAAEESAHLWIGLLLDILESLDCFRNLRKPLVLPGWYVQMVSLLSTVGRTVDGMRMLRSRLPDSAGGEVRPNVIDTAVVQLFQLSLMDSEDETGYLDPAHEQRLFVMRYWLRLLHQVLIFVQSTETISFRSLVVDTHDYYTSACTRIMTDAFVDSDTMALIRSQLDELAMDHEEYDDLKDK
jgi:hypothetical protein